jgi:hypothetical protein
MSTSSVVGVQGGVIPSCRWLLLVLLSTVVTGCLSASPRAGCFTPEQTQQILVALASHQWENVTQATLRTVQVPDVRSWPPSLEEPSRAMVREREEQCEGTVTVVSSQRIIDSYAECFMALTFEFFRNGLSDSSCGDRLVSLDVRYSATGTLGGQKILAEWVAAIEKGLPKDAEPAKPLRYESGPNSLGATTLLWFSPGMQYTLETEMTRGKDHRAFFDLNLTQGAVLPPPHHQ